MIDDLVNQGIKLTFLSDLVESLIQWAVEDEVDVGLFLRDCLNYDAIDVPEIMEEWDGTAVIEGEEDSAEEDATSSSSDRKGTIGEEL